jgi:hypothetical protein
MNWSRHRLGLIFVKYTAVYLVVVSLGAVEGGVLGLGVGLFRCFAWYGGVANSEKEAEEMRHLLFVQYPLIGAAGLGGLTAVMGLLIGILAGIAFWFERRRRQPVPDVTVRRSWPWR